MNLENPTSSKTFFDGLVSDFCEIQDIMLSVMEPMQMTTHRKS